MKTRLPSNKIIWFIIIVLLVVYNIIFVVQMKHRFYFLKYDWNNAKKIASVFDVKVLSVNKSKLVIVKPGFAPASKYTYRLDYDLNPYFFSFEYRIKKGDTVSFYDVHWIKSTPKTIRDNCTITILDIPLIQKAKTSMLTIGDALLCRGAAETFRKNLAKKTDIKFIGTQKDVLNIPHEAKTLIKSAEILNLIKNSKADYYILFFKWHPKFENKETFKKNIIAIRELLNQKNIKKAFLLTIPTNRKNKDLTGLQTNNMISGFNDIKTKLINTDSILSGIRMKYDIYNNLTEESYTTISNYIATLINDEH